MPGISPNLIWDLLKGRSHEEAARISAYLLAPACVLILTVSGVQDGPFVIGGERPLAITELRTELVGPGDVKAKRGVAVIVEPLDGEYRIPFGSGASKLWSSLDEQSLRANRGRLLLDGGGLSGRSPLVGVNAPVAVVIEGELGNEIQVPGRSERVDDWRLPPRRSGSMASSVLIACVFAFGISLSTGLPSARSD